MDDFNSNQPENKLPSRFSRLFDRKLSINLFISLVLFGLISGLVSVILFLDVSVDPARKTEIELFGIELNFPKINIQTKNTEPGKVSTNGLFQEPTSLPMISAAETQEPTETMGDPELTPEDGFDPTQTLTNPTTVSALSTSTSTPSDLGVDPLGVCSPIDGVELYELEEIISQPYDVPNPLSDFGHHGVDLGSYNFHNQYLYAIPVKAILKGRIAGTVVNRPPLGNTILLETRYSELPEYILDLIEIQPGQSLYHLYAHLLDEPDALIGAEFECGDPINLLGKSQTVEAHLHLETVIAESGLTPGSMAFYDTSATEDELEQYRWWRMSGDFIPFDPMTLFLNLPH